MKKLILILYIVLAVAATAEAQSLAQQGDSAYAREDYRHAIELYSRSLAEEGVSTDLYYNLANAYYRNDNPGKAVLNYRRALRIDPTNSDARANLNFVVSRIEDRPEDDSSFLGNLHYSILGLMKPNAWAWTSFGLFVLLTACGALYIFSGEVAMRKTGFFGGIVVLFVFIYALVCALQSAAAARDTSEAVVIAPSTYLNSAPRAPRTSDEPAVSLHAGTVVEITDSVPTPDDPQSDMWYNVRINKGTKAWLRASDVERI